MELVSKYQFPPSMNPIQELQVPSPSTPFAPRFVCPSAPRASESILTPTWSSASSPTTEFTVSEGFHVAGAMEPTLRPPAPTPIAPQRSPPLTFASATSPTNETTFSWGPRPTWTLPPPRSRSGADAPTGGEPTHSWADVVLPPEPESLRHLTMPIQPAVLPSQQADDIIHPDIGRILIRQRGSYWWEKSQAKLEHQFSSGERQPVQGGFYVFLEEEQSGNIVRFGNVLAGAYWRMQTVAFPKGHPDADVPPYQMIDARE